MGHWEHGRIAEPLRTRPDDIVAGVSLRLPRSAYLMTRESRHAFEHHIPPVAALRYAVTFRTLRQRQARSRVGAQATTS